MGREERVQIIILCHNNTFDTLTVDFLDILYPSYYLPSYSIIKTTRVKENSLIDNVLTNSLSEEIKSCVLYSDLV